MRNLRRKFLIVGLSLVATTVSGIVPAHASRTSASGSSRQLSVCKDAEGNTKSGALDVLLLLDNSRSLNTDNGKASDPKNERYGAIGEMLKSLAEAANGDRDQQSVLINFGLVSFGGDARSEIAMKPLSGDNAENLSAEVRKKVPPTRTTQSQTTNYLSALKTSLEVLDNRPAENCKFLVWFTDGQFESDEVSTYDPARSRKIANQADELKHQVCSAGGYADRFVEMGINTFVLVLQPKSHDKRLENSYGAMQAITGDSVLPPEVAKEIGKSTNMCGNVETKPSLGEVLIAGDAKDIARKIPTIANVLTHWTPVTSCPASANDTEMPKMPAARHTARLSFTAYEKGRELSELAKSEIIDNSGNSHPLTDYLVKHSGSRFEQKYELNKRAENELEQGWTFKISNGAAGWCVQMLEYKFEVRFGDTENGLNVEQSSLGGRLVDSDLKSLRYTQPDGVTSFAGISEARTTTTKVKAWLDIDPTDVIYKDPIEVKVLQQNRPSLGCESFTLQADTDIPNDKRISATCVIDTKETKLSDIELKVFAEETLLQKKCNAVLGVAEQSVDDELERDVVKGAISEGLTHRKGRSVVSIVLEAKGRSAHCLSEESNLQISFQSEGKSPETLDLPIHVNVKWKQKPLTWIVWVIVLASLLVVALLNLLLLREIKKRTSRMSKNGLFGVEIPLKLARQRTGQITTTTQDGSSLSSVSFNVDEQFAIKVENDRRHAKFTGGSRSTLKVKLPSLFRPFAPPLLILESKKSVYYAPNFEGGNGLSPLTRQAVIVHSPRPDGDTCMAIVTLLIPNAGAGRDQLVRDLLGSKLTNAIKLAANDEDWFGSPLVQPRNGDDLGPESPISSPNSPENPSPSGRAGLTPPRPGGN